MSNKKPLADVFFCFTCNYGVTSAQPARAMKLKYYTRFC